LLGDLLGFQMPSSKVFEIVIQFGAILAVCWLYRQRFLGVAIHFISDREAQRFVTNLLLGFLPAMVVGALLYGFIKSVLFSVWVVSVMLVVGGLVILIIERVCPPADVKNVNQINPGLALKIGLCQTVAMIPGVSRSGATIMGAMLLRTSREAATEFSFFLAVPTMFAATVYDLYKNWSQLSFGDGPLIAVGFVCAFFAAMVVVRTLIKFVSRNGFAPFAYYRIVVGLVMLAILWQR
jgi:undecaprenyl-diphosphatase